MPAARDKFLDVLTAHRHSIGAVVAVSAMLFDPVSTDPAERIEPMPASVKRKVLALVAASGQTDLLPQVAAFARDPKTAPSLLLAAAETIRQIGLPQDLRPGQDPEGAEAGHHRSRIARLARRRVRAPTNGHRAEGRGRRDHRLAR